MSLYSDMPVTPFHLMAGVVAKSIRISFSPALTLEEVIQAAELIALGVNKLKSH